MEDNHIQYIELYSTDLEKTKNFYSAVFGWVFTDYGEEYTAFTNSGVEGGFSKVEKITQGGPLVVLYHTRLEVAKENVIKGGGTISKEIFSFPGGRRFQFTHPNGNELAVWSNN